MSDLQHEIRQSRGFASRAEEAFLNLQRSANVLFQAHGRFLEPYGLTPKQYNVLRILRGAHPEPLPCNEVGARMVTPMPDVTRLLDRLEAKGLSERRRDAADRRVLNAGITAAGLALLADIDQPLAGWLESTVGRLGDGDLAELVRLLEAVRRLP